MTLLLTRSDVADLLPIEACIEAVEHAFRLHGEGRAEPPGILGIQAHRGGIQAHRGGIQAHRGGIQAPRGGIHAGGGGFHLKAGILDLGRRYFAAKTNGNFPGNPERFGLPTIQGVVLLADADQGSPLALMDSAEITALRTGAATAVAAKYLARADAAVVTVCGCGLQGRVQLRALAAVRPLTRAYAIDRDPGSAPLRACT